jgi:hypothetical protein
MFRKMKKVATLCFFIFSVIEIAVFGQTTTTLPYPKSQFSFGIYSGFNKTNYDSFNNGLSLESTVNHNHIARFAYRYRFNEKVFVETAFNWGTQREKPSYPAEYQYTLPVSYYFSDGFFFNFARFDLLGSYQFAKFNKSSINVLGGIGTNRFAHGVSGITGGLDSNYLRIEYNLKDKFIGMLNIGLEYSFRNKRLDELSIRLMYNHGFSSFYNGIYIYGNNGNLSNSSFSSMLRGLNFGINYTFTRYAKRDQMNAYISENNWNKKQAKRQVKYDQRKIDPKSQFVFLGCGLGMNRVDFKPSNDPLSPLRYGSFMYRAGYERGWKNNFFFESDYFSFTFTEGARIRYNNAGVAWGGNIFNAHFVNVGLLYRIQNKRTNFQFINVHSGLGLGFHFAPNGAKIGNGLSGGLNGLMYNYTSEGEIKSNLMPVLYAGLSKDIRITERLLFNINYRHQFGLNTAVESTYVVFTSEMTEPKEVKSKITGTAFFVQFGFKYRIK